MNYQKIVKNKIQCLICPRKCILAEGQFGFCSTIKNENNNLILTVLNHITGLNIDPVEKKPLYHFFPNSPILSFGTTGCIMGCRFCQNYQTSKSKIEANKLPYIEPNEIIKIAKENNIKLIAFTYNDPIAFLEFAINCAKLAKKEGIKTVAVTSGFINLEPAKEFLSYIDALNIDIKGFSEKFYNKNCFAKLAPVLDFIKLAYKMGKHIELTTLLIEGENDFNDEIQKEAIWIKNNLNENIPLHFSAFFPTYKFNDRKRTSYETLKKAYEIAKKEGLKNVYTGNLTTIETSTTYCTKCNKPLIIRNGYKIEVYNLENNRCKFCGKEQYGEFSFH